MIDSKEKLRVHLKTFKYKNLVRGVDKFALYPLFCQYYKKHQERFDLPKMDVLEMATIILIEED